MAATIKALVRLELCNLYGLNTLRFTKDRKARRRNGGLLAVFGVLLAVLAGYMGGLSYGLAALGLGEVIPAYLIAAASLLAFFLGVVKAGGVLFRREGYDQLCALPFPRGAIVASRLLRMYLEALLPVLAVLVPGFAVYGWQIRPGWGSWLALLLEAWSVPLLPVAGAVLAGGLIAGISARMRRKSLAAASMTILAALAVFYGSSRLSAVEEFTPEMFRELAALVSGLLQRAYPPAFWMGRAVAWGNLPESLLWAGGSLGVFAAAAAGLSLSFSKICGGLFSSPAKQDYALGRLKTASPLAALCLREFRRYFSSSVYVTNTLIGPVMGCVLSGALLAVGREGIEKLPLPADVLGMVPFLLAGVFCTMPVTAVSISMEGKTWWILKSLPLPAKAILDAKILMNLLLLLPFYLVSELLLVFALKPSWPELFWLLAVPAAIILFSCVWGIAANLRFPLLEWESEIQAVKQSASAALGGMGGLILAALSALGVGLAPPSLAGWLKGGLCLAFLLAAALLYRAARRQA